MDPDETRDAADILGRLRGELDEVDLRLIETVAQRFAICRSIAELKRQHGIPMMQPQRIEYVLKRCAELGRESNLDGAFTRKLYELLIAEACRQEDEIVGNSA